jgi:hypothetical protein
MRQKPLVPLLLASLTAWSGLACADTLTITFVSLGGPRPTPISPWVAAVMAVAIALIALTMFRRKGTRMFLLAAALVVAGSAFVLPTQSEAISAIALTSSPYTDVQNCSIRTDTFTSAAPQIQLTSISASGTGIHAGSTCAVGTMLTPSSTCTVAWGPGPC